LKGLIFTYLTAYGGAVVALFNPFVGLLIYFCFAIVKPESMWPWSVPPGNYSRIVAIALLVGWSLRHCGDWDFHAARAIVYALIAYLGWAALSAAFAPTPAVAWRFVELQAKIVLPVVVGITLIDSVEKLKQVAWVLMVSQAYLALEMNRNYLDGRYSYGPVTFAGLDNNGVSIVMVTGAGLAFFLGLGESKAWRKWLCFVAAGLMAHVPMFAMSRGGMLALLLTGVVSFFLIPKQPKHYLLFGLAVVVALRLAGPEVMTRFGTIFADEGSRDSSAQSRVDLWGNAWGVMLREPLLGVGPDHWAIHAVEFGWSEGKEVHSLWMQTGAELGFPGVGFLMAFYGLTGWRLWKLLRRSRGVESSHVQMARMVIASLVGFGVSASFVTCEGIELPFYVTLLGAGTLKLVGAEEMAAEMATPAPDTAGLEIGVA
jgi:putative inorganic carbon (hco3(-)) transporter